MVIHLQDASLAHRTVVRSVWFDTATLRTLKNNFALAKSHLLNVLLGCIAERDGARIGEHRLEMARYCEERCTIKQDDVDDFVDGVGTRQQHHLHHHELRVCDKKPCQHGANDSANVLKIN